MRVDEREILQQLKILLESKEFTYAERVAQAWAVLAVSLSPKGTRPTSWQVQEATGLSELKVRVALGGWKVLRGVGERSKYQEMARKRAVQSSGGADYLAIFDDHGAEDSDRIEFEPVESKPPVKTEPHGVRVPKKKNPYQPPVDLPIRWQKEDIFRKDGDSYRKDDDWCGKTIVPDDTTNTACEGILRQLNDIALEYRPAGHTKSSMHRFSYWYNGGPYLTAAGWRVAVRYQHMRSFNTDLTGDDIDAFFCSFLKHISLYRGWIRRRNLTPMNVFGNHSSFVRFANEMISLGWEPPSKKGEVGWKKK